MASYLIGDLGMGCGAGFVGSSQANVLPEIRSKDSADCGMPGTVTGSLGPKLYWLVGFGNVQGQQCFDRYRHSCDSLPHLGCK